MRIDTVGPHFLFQDVSQDAKIKPERHIKNILTFLLLKYSPTKWPINTIYSIASSDAC